MNRVGGLSKPVSIMIALALAIALLLVVATLTTASGDKSQGMLEWMGEKAGPIELPNEIPTPLSSSDSPMSLAFLTDLSESYSR